MERDFTFSGDGVSFWFIHNHVLLHSLFKRPHFMQMAKKYLARRVEKSSKPSQKIIQFFATYKTALLDHPDQQIFWLFKAWKAGLFRELRICSRKRTLLHL
ncbi:MAG: hypothetical protein JRD89_19350 [Deltaproteobacteria bacterium]|nr:hypothetical protein [Deltaproteobacteria bacterium]